MSARLHPGVYVEEAPGGARSIEAAGTSTAIFVGESERGPTAPTRVKSVGEFERLFGGHFHHTGLALAGTSRRVTLRYAMDAFFQNGGTSAYVLRALPNGATTASRGQVVASSPGAWAGNLGVVFGPSSDADPMRFQLAVLYAPPGKATRSIVERWDRLSLSAADENYAPDVLRRSLYVRWDPAVVPAMPTADVTAPVTETSILAFGGPALTGGADGTPALTAGTMGSILPRLDGVLDASLLVVPAPFDAADGDSESLANAGLAYAEGRAKQDLFCIADLPRRQTSTSATDFVDDTLGAFGSISKTTFGAVYAPWVEVGDPAGAGRDPTIFLGPSSFLAGLYARTDQRRGVWKAPAGLDASLLGARRPEFQLIDAHQDELNPRGINALRVMPAGGHVAWGTRTLRPDSEWRYVPVRRTAILIRTSIYNGIQWAVFEPNDEPLWSALRVSVGAFMDQLFRQGAFAGRTSREAYFVKCDAETTPEADRAAGVVNVWVGFAPLRPAEFVVVKLSQIVNQKA